MTDHQKRKRSKAFYGSFSKRMKSRSLQELDQGMTGFLVTCSDREKQCMSEVINVLTQCADEMYGPETAEGQESVGENEKDTEDVSQSLEKELAELKQTKRARRFQAVQSPSRNVLFIRCNDDVNPMDLTHRILTDAQTRGELTVRYCQRLLPVSLVCHASIDDIKRKAPSILDPHFHSSESKPVSFAVAYRARNNSEMKRDVVIDVVAKLVSGDGSFGHKVNLTSPELVVVVEVVKKHCLMSVVKDYHSLRKYNMHSIVEEKMKTEEPTRKEQDTSESGVTLENS